VKDNGDVWIKIFVKTRVGILIKLLKNFQRHFVAWFIQQFNPEKRRMFSVFLRETFQDAQGFLDVLRILRPVDWPAPPAVVPAVLTARRAVQIQKQFQAIALRLLQGEIYELSRCNKRLRRFQRPITHRQTNGIETAILDPAKIFGGDKSFTMTVQPVPGPISQGKTKAVFIRRIGVAINVRHHPFFKDEPRAQIHAARF